MSVDPLYELVLQWDKDRSAVEALLSREPNPTRAVIRKLGAGEDAREPGSSPADHRPILALAQVPERVDHRSLKRQGVEQEATVHMGPSATAMEGRLSLMQFHAISHQ